MGCGSSKTTAEVYSTSEGTRQAGNFQSKKERSVSARTPTSVQKERVDNVDNVFSVKQTFPSKEKSWKMNKSFGSSIRKKMKKVREGIKEAEERLARAARNAADAAAAKAKKQKENSKQSTTNNFISDRAEAQRQLQSLVQEEAENEVQVASEEQPLIRAKNPHLSTVDGTDWVLSLVSGWEREEVCCVRSEVTPTPTNRDENTRLVLDGVTYVPLELDETDETWDETPQFLRPDEHGPQSVALFDGFTNRAFVGSGTDNAMVMGVPSSSPGLTFECWINPSGKSDSTGSNDLEVILLSSTSVITGETMFELGYTVGRKLFVRLRNGQTIMSVNAANEGDFQPNEWEHVAFAVTTVGAYNFNDCSRVRFDLYVGGVGVTSQQIEKDNAFASFFPGEDVCYALGGRKLASRWNVVPEETFATFQGMMSEVRVWSEGRLNPSEQSRLKTYYYLDSDHYVPETYYSVQLKRVRISQPDDVKWFPLPRPTQPVELCPTAVKGVMKDGQLFVFRQTCDQSLIVDRFSVDVPEDGECNSNVLTHDGETVALVTADVHRGMFAACFSHDGSRCYVFNCGTSPSDTTRAEWSVFDAQSWSRLGNGEFQVEMFVEGTAQDGEETAKSGIVRTSFVSPPSAVATADGKIVLTGASSGGNGCLLVIEFEPDESGLLASLPLPEVPAPPSDQERRVAAAGTTHAELCNLRIGEQISGAGNEDWFNGMVQNNSSKGVICYILSLERDRFVQLISNNSEDTYTVDSGHHIGVARKGATNEAQRGDWKEHLTPLQHHAMQIYNLSFDGNSAGSIKDSPSLPHLQGAFNFRCGDAVTVKAIFDNSGNARTCLVQTDGYIDQTNENTEPEDAQHVFGIYAIGSNGSVAPTGQWINPGDAICLVGGKWDNPIVRGTQSGSSLSSSGSVPSNLNMTQLPLIGDVPSASSGAKFVCGYIQPEFETQLRVYPSRNEEWNLSYASTFDTNRVAIQSRVARDWTYFTFQLQSGMPKERHDFAHGDFVRMRVYGKDGGQADGKRTLRSVMWNDEHEWELSDGYTGIRRDFRIWKSANGSSTADPTDVIHHNDRVRLVPVNSADGGDTSSIDRDQRNESQLSLFEWIIEFPCRDSSNVAAADRVMDLSKDGERNDEHSGRFPAHWGDPPSFGTKDIRDLPGGYGKGSTTLANWIEEHMKKDASKSKSKKKSIPKSSGGGSNRYDWRGALPSTLIPHPCISTVRDIASGLRRVDAKVRLYGWLIASGQGPIARDPQMSHILKPSLVMQSEAEPVLDIDGALVRPQQLFLMEKYANADSIQHGDAIVLRFLRNDGSFFFDSVHRNASVFPSETGNTLNLRIVREDGSGSLVSGDCFSFEEVDGTFNSDLDRCSWLLGGKLRFVFPTDPNNVHNGVVAVNNNDIVYLNRHALPFEAPPPVPTLRCSGVGTAGMAPNMSERYVFFRDADFPLPEVEFMTNQNQNGSGSLYNLFGNRQGGMSASFKALQTCSWDESDRLSSNLDTFEVNLQNPEVVDLMWTFKLRNLNEDLLGEQFIRDGDPVDFLVPGRIENFEVAWQRLNHRGRFDPISSTDKRQHNNVFGVRRVEIVDGQLQERSGTASEDNIIRNGDLVAITSHWSRPINVLSSSDFAEGSVPSTPDGGGPLPSIMVEQIPYLRTGGDFVIIGYWSEVLGGVGVAGYGNKDDYCSDFLGASDGPYVEMIKRNAMGPSVDKFVFGVQNIFGDPNFNTTSDDFVVISKRVGDSLYYLDDENKLHHASEVQESDQPQKFVFQVVGGLQYENPVRLWPRVRGEFQEDNDSVQRLMVQPAWHPDEPDVAAGNSFGYGDPLLVESSSEVISHTRSRELRTKDFVFTFTAGSIHNSSPVSDEALAYWQTPALNKRFSETPRVEIPSSVPRLLWDLSGTPQYLSMYTISVSSERENKDSDPECWVFEGRSAVDGSWVTLDTRWGQTFDIHKSLTFQVVRLMPCTSYRLTIVGIRRVEAIPASTSEEGPPPGATGSRRVILDGVALKVMSDVQPIQGAMNVRSSSGASYRATDPDQQTFWQPSTLTSSNTSEWLELTTKLGPSTGRLVSILSYTITSTNANHAPARWRLQRSHLGDGSDWTDVDVRDNIAGWAGPKEFIPQQSVEFASLFRLLVQFVDGEKDIQICDISFRAVPQGIAGSLFEETSLLAVRGRDQHINLNQIVPPALEVNGHAPSGIKAAIVMAAQADGIPLARLNGDGKVVIHFRGNSEVGNATGLSVSQTLRLLDVDIYEEGLFYRGDIRSHYVEIVYDTLSSTVLSIAPSGGNFVQTDRLLAMPDPPSLFKWIGQPTPNLTGLSGGLAHFTAASSDDRGGMINSGLKNLLSTAKSISGPGTLLESFFKPSMTMTMTKRDFTVIANKAVNTFSAKIRQYARDIGDVDNKWESTREGVGPDHGDYNFLKLADYNVANGLNDLEEMTRWHNNIRKEEIASRIDEIMNSPWTNDKIMTFRNEEQHKAFAAEYSRTNPYGGPAAVIAESLVSNETISKVAAMDDEAESQFYKTEVVDKLVNFDAIIGVATLQTLKTSVEARRAVEDPIATLQKMDNENPQLFDQVIAVIVEYLEQQRRSMNAHMDTIESGGGSLLHEALMVLGDVSLYELTHTLRQMTRADIHTATGGDIQSQRWQAMRARVFQTNNELVRLGRFAGTGAYWEGDVPTNPALELHPDVVRRLDQIKPILHTVAFVAAIYVATDLAKNGLDSPEEIAAFVWAVGSALTKLPGTLQFAWKTTKLILSSIASTAFAKRLNLLHIRKLGSTVAASSVSVGAQKVGTLRNLKAMMGRGLSSAAEGLRAGYKSAKITWAAMKTTKTFKFLSGPVLEAINLAVSTYQLFQLYNAGLRPGDFAFDIAISSVAFAAIGFIGAVMIFGGFLPVVGEILVLVAAVAALVLLLVETICGKEDPEIVLAKKKLLHARRQGDRLINDLPTYTPEDSVSFWVREPNPPTDDPDEDPFYRPHGAAGGIGPVPH